MTDTHRIILLPLASLAVALAGLGTATPASAEADADIGVRAAIVVKFDELGRFVALREKWSFDFEYSATMKQAVDADGNGTLDQSELDHAPDGALAWLRTADYFTRIREGGQQLPHREAEDFNVAFPAGQLILEFTLPLRDPPRLAIQTIELSDPDFFYAIVYDYPDIQTEGAPDYCSVGRRSTVGDSIDVEVKCR